MRGEKIAVPVLKDNHDYLVGHDSRTHHHVLDGETCKRHQIYKLLSSNRTANRTRKFKNNNMNWKVMLQTILIVIRLQDFPNMRLLSKFKIFNVSFELIT